MHLSAPELSQILEYLPRDCARLLVPDGAAEYSSRNQAEAGLTWTAIPIDVAQTKFLRPIRETIEIQVLSVEETGLHEGENGLLQHTHSRFQFAVVNLSWIPQAQPRPDRGRNHESHMTLVVFKSSRFGLGCQVCSHRQTSPWSSSSWSCFSWSTDCRLLIQPHSCCVSFYSVRHPTLTCIYIYIYIDQAPPILDLLEIRIGLLRAVLSSCFAEVGSRFSAFAHPICMMLI